MWVARIVATETARVHRGSMGVGSTSEHHNIGHRLAEVAALDSWLGWSS